MPILSFLLFIYQKRLDIFKLDILERINSIECFYKNYEEQ